MLLTILVATHGTFKRGLTPSSGKAPKFSVVFLIISGVVTATLGTDANSALISAQDAIRAAQRPRQGLLLRARLDSASAVQLYVSILLPGGILAWRSSSRDQSCVYGSFKAWLSSSECRDRRASVKRLAFTGSSTACSSQTGVSPSASP